MAHAFPEDELKPISCAPQTRNRENPADIGLNDVLGNYSLTLIDSLSTLAILASSESESLQDFKDGVKALVNLYGAGDGQCGTRACGFDLDSKVQVFETNIRGVGGLLSAHLFAAGELPITGYTPDGWYNGELLRLAKDLATRLLPAFDTPTGLPYPRVNLRHGASFYQDAAAICLPDGSTTSKEATETCSAGAGSLVLEFSTLSRLTGDDKFESLAKKAFWAVWERRSAIGLIGNGVDAETGQWTMPTLSGIGAGIDSFYEYALKSSILLSGLPYTGENDPNDFLITWQMAHGAVKHHILRSTHTEKHPFYGQTDQFTGAPRYAWIDNLSAYYPGLLTLAGELEEAIEAHLVFAALWTRYAALPERWVVPNAFIDPNFKHWAGRPEFIESTYYLYQATKDPFYLHTGEMALRDIRRRCWTRCGWADLGDVVSGEKRDRMESFFLGETAKYLYLLFDQDHPLNKMDAPVVFTTEGHPLIIPRKPGMYAEGKSPQAAPMCPAPPTELPLTVSNLVRRADFFHAAALAQLHLVPIQPARASALMEASDESPAVTLADIRSPTNYTYYPWTLPQDLIPPQGLSTPIKNPKVSTLTFPNLNAQEGEKPVLNAQGLHKFIDGILVSSLSNLRLNMVQEPRALLMPDSDGLLVEIDAGSQYRVHGVANWALGRDEKVLLTREAMDGVAPGDPNFNRVKDLEMVDIILDFPPPQAQRNASDPRTIMETMEDFPGVSDTLAASTPSTTAPVRTVLPAILPTGIGAVPLAAEIDASDPAMAAPGSLPLTTIYFLDDALCPPHKLPAAVARTHQIIVIKRGGCSFNDKLSSIPSFIPSEETLQTVIILSTPETRSPPESVQHILNSKNADDLNEKMIRPLLDEKQTTPGGFERRYGIPMMMVDAREEVVLALRAAATTIAWYEGGTLQERNQQQRASGIGIKRRYWFESMGIPIGNLIAL